MLRDNLVGLIKPMLSSAGANPLALCIAMNESSDDRPQDALKIPAPKGRNLTLTENAASPFHAEPKHFVSEVSWKQNLWFPPRSMCACPQKTSSAPLPIKGLRFKNTQKPVAMSW